MKNSSFKIGEEIFYMYSNKPVSKKITSIYSIEGELEIGYSKFKSENGFIKVLYKTEYDVVEDVFAFANIEDLKKSVFNY